MQDVIKLIISLVGITFGVVMFIQIMKKHKLVDTESIAVVKDVQDLGLSDLKHVYAIRYDVCSSAPFELLETPSKKKRKLGSQRTVFYEQENHKNYYFKTIGQFDRRLAGPILLIVASLSIFVLAAGRLLF
jgi:hypothetical protein